MPKSYRFHPYNVHKRTQDRTMRESDKEHFTHPESSGPAPAEGLHYGKKFSETERLVHEHAEHPKMSRPHHNGVIQSHELRGQPIGALPRTEEPFLPEGGLEASARWSDVVGEARRGIERLGGAVRDLSEATLKLARLPFDVAKLLGRRTRPA